MSSSENLKPSVLMHHFRSGFKNPEKVAAKSVGLIWKWWKRMAALTMYGMGCAIVGGFFFSSGSCSMDVKRTMPMPDTDSLVEHYSIDYQAYAMPRDHYPSAGPHGLFASLETTPVHTIVQGGRHAKTVAEIMDKTADELLGRDVDTRLIGKEGFTQEPEVEQIIRRALVVNMSSLNLEGQLYNVERADQMWQDSRAIAVEAIGNEGHLCQPGDVRPQRVAGKGPFYRSDTRMKIGMIENGRTASYNSCNGPDLLVDNIFDEGFEYRVYPSADRIRMALEDNRWPSPIAFAFGSGYFYLSKLLATAAGYEHAPDHPFNGGKGTSFAAPRAAGTFVAARIKYPDLHEYEIIAAALATARPVWRIQNSHDVLSYHDNGRGFLYNETSGGFGKLMSDDFFRHLQKLDDLRRARPDAQLIEKRLSAPPQLVAQDDDTITYRFNITQNATLTNAMFHIQMPPHNGYGQGKQDEYVLIRPDGQRIKMGPGLGRMKIDATTRQVLGTDAQGVWEVQVPAHLKIDHVSLTLIGAEKGGILDEYLDFAEAEKRPHHEFIKHVRAERQKYETKPYRPARSAPSLRPNS